METLAKEIRTELRAAKHCAVYEPELKRVWPRSDKSREAKIAEFARERGWRLRFYREGLCAIFDEDRGMRSRKAKSM
jgi:hypothetical protein